MIDIKKCPFCGGGDIKYSLKTTRVSRKRKYHASYFCNDCHTYGPRVLSNEIGNSVYSGRTEVENDECLKETALNKWNKRQAKLG